MGLLFLSKRAADIYGKRIIGPVMQFCETKAARAHGTGRPPLIVRSWLAASVLGAVSAVAAPPVAAIIVTENFATYLHSRRECPDRPATRLQKAPLAVAPHQ